MKPEMEMKKLHLGTVAFGWDSMDEVAHLLASTLSDGEMSSTSCCLFEFELKHRSAPTRRKSSLAIGIPRGRRDMSSRVRDAVMALATCHSVSGPVVRRFG